MSTPNHTPGPWRIIDSRDQSKATIVGADFPAMGFVADVNLCRNNTHQQVDGRANAALIVTAPAMYAVLKEAFYALSYHMPDRFDDEEQECAWHQRMLKIEQVLAQAEDKP